MLRPRAASGRPVLVPGLLAAALAAAAGLAVTGGGAGAAPTPAAKVVVLRGVAFHAAVTRIHPGQSVTWSWEDPYVTHNLHAVGTLRFKGASARLKGRHTVRFTRAGTYRYTCTLHPGMNGRIVVR